jgi:hypothetical protein
LGTTLVPREIPFRANLICLSEESAIKLPHQVRSKVQLGNEGKTHLTDL